MFQVSINSKTCFMMPWDQKFFNNENNATTVEDATQFDASFDDPYGVSIESIFEEPKGDAKEFFDLLRAADTPLFDGCDDGVIALKWVCELMSARTLFNMSVTNWDYVLKRSLMAFKKLIGRNCQQIIIVPTRC
ncbi:hypothetical protein SLA2020_032550 [Shorea laevis]